MTSSKTVWVALIAVAIIAIGGYLFPQQAALVLGAVTPSTTTDAYATESDGAPLFVLGNAVVGPNSTGAVGYTGYISTIGSRIAATSGTTTPCAIANPLAAALALGNAATATGTIQSFAFTVTAPTSTTVIYSVGTSTTPFGTSSAPFLIAAIGAGAQGTISWDAGANNAVISPNQYIVVGSSGGTGSIGAGGIIVGGTCQVVVQSAS